jgi:hypothetical protein
MVIPSQINRTNLYYAGLAMMLIALPLSKYLMSVAQFSLLTVWLLDRQNLNKWKAFFSNRAAMVLVSFFILHVIGLLWTSDFNYALKDLRIKLPLLALPVIISTSPKINQRVFSYLMLTFIIANVLGTVASMHELLTKEIVEIRKISLFMSHIRFSLNICVAIFAAIYLIFGSGFFNRKVKFALFITVVWLLIFLVILESVTGLALIIIISGVLGMVAVFQFNSGILKTTFAVILILIPLLLFFYIKGLYEDFVPDKPFTYQGMDLTTKQGNYYAHDTSLKMPENGHWVGQYIHWGELRESWSGRSSIDFDSLDHSGHYVRFTLVRYLTSKGLRKDAQAMKSLSDEEIRHIENGIANVRQLAETNLENRLRTIIWEVMLYRETGYLSGHSVTQRIEFWRAGVRIIKNNFWIGTGTGDISNAYKKEYEEMNTSLEQKFRWRSHNQYMAIFATFGIIGFLWFLFAIIYPPLRLRMFSDYFYLVFFLTFVFSMLTEDTLENQAGATFFAFFTSFFLFARSEKMKFFTRKKSLKNDQ